MQKHLSTYLLLAYAAFSLIGTFAQRRPVAFYDFDSPSGESWSSYWYNGRIYSNDMVRGVDVFSMVTPWSPYGQQWTHLNAQTQEDLYIPSLTALGRLSQRAKAP